MYPWTVIGITNVCDRHMRQGKASQSSGYVRLFPLSSKRLLNRFAPGYAGQGRLYRFAEETSV